MYLKFLRKAYPFFTLLVVAACTKSTSTYVPASNTTLQTSSSSSFASQGGNYSTGGQVGFSSSSTSSVNSTGGQVGFSSSSSVSSVTGQTGGQIGGQCQMLPPFAAMNSPSTSQNLYFSCSQCAGPSSGYECRLDGGSWGACQSTSSHSLSNLSNGTHVFDVRYKYSNGAICSSASHTWSVNIPLSGTCTIQSPYPSTLTSSGTVKYSCSCNVAGGSTQCRWNNGSWGSCTTNNSYNYSSSTTGPQVFDVRYNTPSGQVCAQNTYSWNIAPTGTCSVQSPYPSTSVSSGSLNFNCNCSDPNSVKECRLNGGNWSACTTSSTHNFSGISSGNQQFEVRTKTSSGALCSQDMYSWYYNTPAPTGSCSVTPLASSTLGSPSGTLNYNCSCSEPIQSRECRLNGGAWGSCSTNSTYLYNLSSVGNQIFEVRGKTASQQICGQELYSWNYQPTGSCVLQPLSTSALSQSSGVLNYNCSCSAQGGITQCRLNGGAWGSCTSTTQASFSGLSPGNQTYEVRILRPDQQLCAQDSYAWNYQPLPPTGTCQVQSPLPQSNASTGNVSFACSCSQPTGLSYQCRFNGGTWGACTTSTLYSYSALTAGVQSLEVKTLTPTNQVCGQMNYSWNYVPPLTGSCSVNAPYPSSTSSSGLLNYSCSCMEGSQVVAGASSECRLNSGSWGPCSGVNYHSYSSLSSGGQFFEVRHKTPSGSVCASGAYSWNYSSAPPTCSLGAMSFSSNNTLTQVLFSGQTSTGAVPTRFECQVPGYNSGLWDTCSSPELFNLGTVAGQSYTLNLKAVDSEGKTSPLCSKSWTNGNWPEFNSCPTNLSCGQSITYERSCTSPSPSVLSATTYEGLACSGYRFKTCTQVCNQTKWVSYLFDTTTENLRAWNNCQPQTPESIDYRDSLMKYCSSSAQWVAGWGPLSVNASTGSVNLACLAFESAEVRNVLASVLGTSCSATNPTSTSCLMAANQACRNQGFAAGYGPVNKSFASTGTAQLVCIKNNSGIWLNPTLADLTNRNSACNSTSVYSSTACRSAANAYCRAQSVSYQTGIGPFTSTSSAPLPGSVYCANGTISY